MTHHHSTDPQLIRPAPPPGRSLISSMFATLFALIIVTGSIAAWVIGIAWIIGWLR